MKIPIIIFTLGLSFWASEFITLEDLKWKKRIVLIFPESKDYIVDVSDSLQMKMEERDMVYFVFSDSLYSNTDFEFDSSYVEDLKSRYILGAKTTCWVLLGKDGGLKYRQEKELDWNQAFNTVDAMALRRQMGIWE